MTISKTRREFIQLSAFGFGTAVFAFGMSGCDDNLSEGISFQHGIASGDPLDDRVILWTRATPQDASVKGIHIGWEVALDPQFASVVNSGTTTTTADRDFTIKIDAAGLLAGTSYYYRFRSKDAFSPVGRTKTLVDATAREIKLAVVSCSNYPAGRFHVYREIARRADLDAVLHLGDYIYEYQRGGYASQHAPELGREVLPEHELFSLDDYRTRYAQYRSDKDLQLAHQNHPFITVWDDHEVANDAWSGGADNQQPDETPYEQRKLYAMQAYSEWLPIRSHDPEDIKTIYRSFKFGKLVALHMLDTRLIGRDQPLEYRNYFDANGFAASRFQADRDDPNRSMLGAEQRTWLYAQLADQDCVWQVLGQQVLMGRMDLPGALSTQQISLAGFARLVKLAKMAAQGLELSTDDLAFLTANQKFLKFPLLPYNLDAWDTYEAERRNLLHQAKEFNTNLVVLAGDSHNAWANNLVVDNEACGVEFGVTSMTSPGLEDILGITPEAVVPTEQQILSLIANLRFTNTYDRGYLIMTFNEAEASGEFVFVDGILKDLYEVLIQRGRTLKVKAGDNFLTIT